MQILSESSPVFARSVRLRMWRNSILLALGLLIVFTAYVYVLMGKLNLFFFTWAVAGAAGFMIGFSFAMSGVCYYFDFLDKKIAYRKYLGLVGFWLVFLYVVLTVIVNPQKYFYGFFDNWLTADFVLGMTAVEIFAFMTLISTNGAMRRMGIINWRRGMRLGYLAYALLIARAVILEGNQWLVWLAAPRNLPSLKLVASVFASSVLLFRGSLIIAKYLKNK